MRLLEASDILVIPSDYPEGLPTLILEGGLTRCAVIATDRGGSREVIWGDHLGCIIPGLDRQKFFEAMESLVKDPELRFRMQENLHQVVMNTFSWEESVKPVIKLLEQQAIIRAT
jgi:glycosyltransferase involved in cell wall biosynthesis